MAENSGFFDANLVNGAYDRVYLADSFAKYFASFVGNGIFGGKLNELMIVQSATSGMKVEVSSGMGWINGYWYENTNNLSLNIDIADGVLNRIDCVVLRWSKSDRSIKVVVKKGTFASAAIAPSIQRDADIYELKLAEVYVKAGATSITQTDITDTRFDKNVCGLVTGLIEQIDIAEFSGLLNSALNEIEIKTRDKIDSIVGRLNALIEDESNFASLALEIDNVANEVALAKQTLGYTKKNLIPYPYKETSVTSNGITYVDNKDGTITVNGTATIDAYFTLYRGKITFGPGKYFVTSGIDIAGRSIYVRFVNSDGTLGSAHFGYNTTPFEITNEDIDSREILIGTIIRQGTTVSNLIFKPMFRKAEILDGSWEPYKLSVAETIREDENDKGCFYRINRFTGKKEWLNPTCAPGWEYPLVERWNNEPVYQMTLYAASLPNKSAMVLETNADWDKIISVSGYALDSDDLTSYPFPVTLHSQVMPIAVISRIEGDGSLVITTNGDASYLEAYITVKYTKSS